MGDDSERETCRQFLQRVYSAELEVEGLCLCLSHHSSPAPWWGPCWFTTTTLKKQRERLGRKKKKRVWGVMSKMLHSDVMLDYTVMVCLWSHVNVFSAFWNNLKAFHRAQRKTSTLRFKITNTHPHTISASFLIVSPNALSYNFTHLTNPFALHHHKFSQILQHSFHSFQIKGYQPLAASITELVSYCFLLLDF